MENYRIPANLRILSSFKVHNVSQFHKLQKPRKTRLLWILTEGWLFDILEQAEVVAAVLPPQRTLCARDEIKSVAAHIYLGLKVAEEYQEQEPAWKAARWYHLLWFLVPVVGFLGFLSSVERNHYRSMIRDGA